MTRDGWKIRPMTAPGRQRRTTRFANGTIVVLHRGRHLYAKFFPHRKRWDDCRPDTVTSIIVGHVA